MNDVKDVKTKELPPIAARMRATGEVLQRMSDDLRADITAKESAALKHAVHLCTTSAAFIETLYRDRLRKAL